MCHAALSQNTFFEKFAQEAAASVAQHWGERTGLKLPECSVENLTDAIWECLLREEWHTALRS